MFISIKTRNLFNSWKSCCALTIAAVAASLTSNVLFNELIINHHVAHQLVNSLSSFFFDVSISTLNNMTRGWKCENKLETTSDNGKKCKINFFLNYIKYCVCLVLFRIARNKSVSITLCCNLMASKWTFIVVIL
jgi:hypothetical protein